MKLFRAWTTLLMLSFNRLLWSMNTLMVLFPLGGCALFLIWRRYDRMKLASGAFDDFSEEFMIFLFTSFVVPVCALAYATTSIGGDREDRTLLFLLVRPVPRWLILLAKLLATLPLVLGLVMISFWVYCQLAGSIGQTAFWLYLTPVFYMTVAYVSLFHLFAVTFRHSTIVALIYSLFMEFLLGNMPGLIKRIAVNFYGRSMMYDLGGLEGLRSPDPEWFVPVSAWGAGWSLMGISAGAVLLTLLIFSLREYRDLT
jgi:ABC-type transport system involved in multi-copper enzyme maturation permease subunit